MIYVNLIVSVTFYNFTYMVYVLYICSMIFSFKFLGVVKVQLSFPQSLICNVMRRFVYLHDTDLVQRGCLHLMHPLNI